MNLSVSNLAWDSDTHIEILEMLNDIGIVQIEGVPVKINSWQNLTIPEIINFKQHMDSKQIQVKSLQSIFYNSDMKREEDAQKGVSMPKMPTMPNIPKFG